MTSLIWLIPPGYSDQLRDLAKLMGKLSGQRKVEGVDIFCTEKLGGGVYEEFFCLSFGLFVIFRKSNFSVNPIIGHTHRYPSSCSLSWHRAVGCGLILGKEMILESVFVKDSQNTYKVVTLTICIYSIDIFTRDRWYTVVHPRPTSCHAKNRM